MVTGAVDNPLADSVQFHHRKLGSTDWTVAGTGDKYTTRYQITGLQDGQQYEAGVSYTVGAYASPVTSIGSATVGANIAGGVRDGGITWNGSGPGPIANVPPALDVDPDGNLQPNNIATGVPGQTLEQFTAEQIAFNDQLEADQAAAEQAITDGLAAAEAARAQLQTALEAADQTITTSVDGIRNEVSDARGTSSTLGGRLTTITNELGNKAEATRVSSLEARADAIATAVIADFPEVIAPEFFTTVWAGLPNTVTGLPAAHVANGAYTPPASAEGRIAFKQTVPWRVGAVYEITADLEGVTTGTTDPAFRMYASALKVDHTDTGSLLGQSTPAPTWRSSPVGSVTTHTWRIAMDVDAPNATRWNKPTDTAHVRFGTVFNRTTTGSATNTGAQTRIRRLIIRDVTAQANVERADIAAVVRGGNQGFEDGLTGWAGVVNTTTAPTNATWASNFQGRPNVVSTTTKARTNLFTIKKFQIDTARKYRMRSSFFIGAGTGVCAMNIGYRALDGAGAFAHSNPVYSVTSSNFAANSGWVERLSPVMTGENGTGSAITGAFPAGTREIILQAYLNTNNNPDIEAALDGVWLEDITESAAAQTAADAVSARTTTLETATANLQSGKADASRVTALETSVNAPGTGLTSRLTAVETATVDLQANKAAASRVTALEALAVPAPNLAKNGDFAQGFKFWPAVTGPWTTTIDTNWGSLATLAPGDVTQDYWLWTDPIPVLSSNAYSLSFNGSAGAGAGAMRIYCSQYDASGNYIPEGDGQALMSFDGASFTTRKSASFTTLSNTRSVKIVLHRPANTGSYTAYVTRIMLNAGATASSWSDAATARDVSARLTTQETVSSELVSRGVSGGNLIGNAALMGATGWVFIPYDLEPQIAFSGLNGPVDMTPNPWRPAPDNTLSSLQYQPITTGAVFADWYSDHAPVEPGKRYEFGAFSAAHSTFNKVYMALYKSDGSDPMYLDAGGSPPAATGGQNLAVGWHLHREATTIPTGYTIARLILRRYSTQAPATYSWSWFTRPFIREISPGQTLPSPWDYGDAQWLNRARWRVNAAVPGADAFISAEADNASGLPQSRVAIGAQSVQVWNPVGGDYQKALEVSQGRVLVMGDLQAGGKIRLGNGQGWDVALKPVNFQRGDGEAISFGTDLGVLPSYEFQRDNLLPLNTGESYDLKLTNLTSTGATVSAKINVPGAPSSQTNSSNTAQTSGPRIQAGVTDASKPVSVTGVYTLTGGVSGTVRVFRQTEEYEGTYAGTVTVWAKKSGVWQQIGTLSWTDTSFYSNPSNTNISEPFYAPFAGSLQMGENVQAIGVSIGDPGGVTNCNPSSINLAWTSAPAPSGTRTALAAGAKTTIKITPQ